MTDRPTQPTQPKKAGAKPIQIPVPTRDEFMHNMDKVASPAKGKPKPESDEPESGERD
jgi:hypothetical protein